MAARLYEDFWNDSGKTDEASLNRALLLKPDVIGPALTFLLGREDERFPLSFVTEGLGNSKEIEGIEYQYDVISRFDKALPLAEAVSTGLPGKGYSQFEIKFAERWFVKQYVLFTPSGYQLRIMDDPRQEGSNWIYRVSLMSGDPEAYVPLSELTAGTLFAQGFAPVAPGGSRGNESNWVAPSKMAGHITHIRKSYKYEGNAPHRTMTVEIPINGKMTKLWWDFEEYQHNLKWRQELETLLLYGESNRDSQGMFHQKDDNGQAIIVGDGLLAQIINKDTYGELTGNKIKSVVRDALYGMSDAQNKVIDLYTGTGGIDEFDRAMKADLSSQSYIKLSDNKFVTGSGRNLSIGGYFTQYQHIDGHIINVRKMPMFDHGPKALVSAKHPKSGLPMESYRMVFVDRSRYDGDSNIMMLTQKGRKMLRWAVAGATIPPGFSGNDLRASDIDGASIHLMKCCGLILRRFNTSIDLSCNLS
jgi:hypothetical protein